MNQMLQVLDNGEIVILLSPEGRTMSVHGAEFVPWKLVQLAGRIADLRHPETGYLLPHKITNIVFRNDELPIKRNGETQFGTYIPEADSVVVNIPMHIEKSKEIIKDVKNGGYKTAFRATIWMNIIITMFHEFFHSHQMMVKLKNSPMRAAREFTKEDESAAEEMQNKMLLEMASRIDIELPIIPDEWPYFGHKINEFEKTFALSGEEWAANQAIMLHSDYIYYDPGQNELKTIEQFMRLAGKTFNMKIAAGEKEAPSCEILRAMTRREIDKEVEKRLAELEAEKLVKTADMELKVIQDKIEKAQQDFINSKKAEMKDLGISEPTFTQISLFIEKTEHKTFDEVLDSIAESTTRVAAPFPISNVPFPILSNVPLPPTPVLSNVPLPPKTVEQEVIIKGRYTPDDTLYGGPTITEYDTTLYRTEPEDHQDDFAYDDQPFDHDEVKAESAKMVAAKSEYEIKRLQGKPKMQPIELPPEECWKIMEAVAKRAVFHMATKCGFVKANQDGILPANAPYGWDRSMVGAVAERVPVLDIPNTDKIIISMAAKDHKGNTKWNMAPEGFIKGDLTDKIQLPLYRFEILGADGMLHSRSLIPQNPTTGTFTATEAKAGERIFYWIDEDKSKEDKDR